MQMKSSLFFQNLIQALRHLRRTTWQTLVSLIGIVTGIVSMTLSANWLWTEFNHDYFRPDYRNLHVLTTGDAAGLVSVPVRDAVENIAKNEGIEVAVSSAFAIPSKFSLLDDGQKPPFAGKYCGITPEWFKMMQPRMVMGDERQLFEGHKRVLLSRKMATYFFPCVEAAIGKTLHCGTLSDNFTVAGVFEDVPGETVYDCDAYFFLDQVCKPEVNSTYIIRSYQLLLCSDNPADAVERIARGLEQYEHVDAKVTASKPLRYKAWLRSSDTFLDTYLYPLAFFVISFILLLGALVNVLMVCISTFLGRTREYTLRRCLGASARQNGLWILTETLPVFLLGLLFATVVLEWMKYAHWVPGSEERVFLTFSIVAVGTLALLCLSLLYPMWLMHRAYRLAFAGRTVNAATHSYLLMAQSFACALMLFIALGMQRQLSTMIYGDLGFERDNILRLYTGSLGNRHGIGEVHDFGAVARALPDVFKREVGAGITDAILMPADIFSPITEHGFRVFTTQQQRELQPYVGTDEFYKISWEMCKDRKTLLYIEIPFRAMDFFHIAVDEGEPLHAEGLSSNELPVLLNRQALDDLQEDFPTRLHYHYGRMSHISMGRMDNEKEKHFEGAPLRIQGVTHLTNAPYFGRPAAMAFVGVPENHDCYLRQHDAVYVKHAPGRREEVEAVMRHILTTKFDVPEEKISLMSLDEYISSFYEDPLQFATLLSLIAALCVFITFSGVFSLLLYSLRLRRRQMAIRRVMGASFGDVWRATLPPYLVFTLLGGVAAYVPAHLFLDRWMSSFTTGETPGIGFMAAIVGGMLVVVCLLVYFQVRRAMHEKPVDVLSPEA